MTSNGYYNRNQQQQRQRRGLNTFVFVLPLLVVLPVLVVSYPPNKLLSLRTLPYHPATTTTVAMASQRPSSSSTTSLEEIQNEIVELREIATHRLEALLEQMEDLKQMNHNNEQQQQQQQNHPVTVVVAPQAEAEAEADSTESKMDITTAKTAPERTKEIQPEVIPSSTTTTNSTGTTITTTIPQQPEVTSLNLLDDTTWKIVYNIGREKGTWMPKDWGISGDRLLFQCTVQFTKEPLSSAQYHDEFFHESSSMTTDTTKQLIVQDAFIVPRGVGDASVGRRPLPVQTVGAYKVCRNQGPCGTDIVRFYIELTDMVTVPDHTSDVYCPSGRIYATCGYFPIHHTSDTATKPSKREMAHEQYQEALRECEHIQLQIDSDTRGLFNVEHFKLLQQSWMAKQRMDEMASKLRVAQQQEPEKSQLRLNMEQTVGLTREGGVCCKVHKGLALEYHILGKIEVGCMHHH